LPEKASILFAFRGYDTPGLSNTGGVIGNQLIIETSGDALENPNPRIRSYFQWFFAHEAAHLFQSVSGIGYDHNGLSWISEGGANAMANQLLAESGLATPEHIRDNYVQSYRLCTEALNGRTLAATIKRGVEGNYDCGDFLARISDAALPDHSLAQLWSAMAEQVAANPAEEDAVYTADHYFTAMTKLGASPDIIAQMRAFTDEPVEDADAALRAMMEAVGIVARFENDLLSDIDFPE